MFGKATDSPTAHVSSKDNKDTSRNAPRGMSYRFTSPWSPTSLGARNRETDHHHDVESCFPCQDGRRVMMNKDGCVMRTVRPAEDV